LKYICLSKSIGKDSLVTNYILFELPEFITKDLPPSVFYDVVSNDIVYY